MSTSKAESSKKPYLHRGQVLSSPPFSARLRSFMTEAEAFLSLYVTTFFSVSGFMFSCVVATILAGIWENAFDPHASARQWQDDRAANVHAQGRGGSGNTNSTATRGWDANRGNGAGGGSGAGGPSGSGVRNRRLGTVDDVRGPECKSCS